MNLARGRGAYFRAIRYAPATARSAGTVSKRNLAAANKNSARFLRERPFQRDADDGNDAQKIAADNTSGKHFA